MACWLNGYIRFWLGQGSGLGLGPGIALGAFLFFPLVRCGEQYSCVKEALAQVSCASSKQKWAFSHYQDSVIHECTRTVNYYSLAPRRNARAKRGEVGKAKRTR